MIRNRNLTNFAEIKNDHGNTANFSTTTWNANIGARIQKKAQGAQTRTVCWKHTEKLGSDALPTLSS
jgi:hypothetical protein